MANKLTKRADSDRKLFDEIARSYSNKDYLPAQRAARRHRLLQTIACANFSRGKILEIGCGAGFAAKYLSGLYEQYLGIDYSIELIKFAQAYNSAPNVSFMTADILDFETDERFDAVFMIGLLHHMADPEYALFRVSQFVKPGGWIIANEPQSGNPIVSAARWFRKRFDASYSSDQDEYDRKQLLDIFLQTGLEQVAVIPQGLFSTPFAEVSMPLQVLVTPVSKAACVIDRFLESTVRGVLYRLAWNLIAVGRKPLR